MSTHPEQFTLPLDGHMLRTYPEEDYLDGLAPYWHQCQTKQLFEEGEPFVAMNSAPTGSGKSYSYWYPVAEHCLNTLILYPRNSLIEDQKRALEEFFETFYPSLDYGIVTGTEEALYTDRQNAIDSISNGDMLYRNLSQARKQNDLVLFLTNPDIFTMMRKGMYRNQSVKSLLKMFEVGVVDEFHMASRKQKNTVSLLLHEMYDRDDVFANLSKILFLSATPEREIATRFDLYTDANYQHIFSNSGWKPQSDIDLTSDHQYRSVLPPVDLTVRRAETHNTADKILDNFADFQSFCLGGKTLVMLDSVTEVERVYQKLSNACPNKTVHAISGFRDDNKREKLASFDILVSNSAVEVGIDFDIDRLVFSAHGSETLIQRLGRLRNKHDELAPGKVWQARCYVPKNTFGDLKDFPDSPRERLTRPGAIYQINNSYLDTEPPSQFDTNYSSIEGYSHLVTISDDYTPDERDEYIKNAAKRIKQHYYDPNDEAFDSSELARLIDNDSFDSRLLEHMKPYRTTGFQTLVYDTTSSGQNALKTYDPIPLTRNGDVEYVTKPEFYKIVPAALKNRAEAIDRHTTGYAIYRGQRDPDADIGKVCLTPTARLRQEIGKGDITERNPIVTKGMTITTIDGGQEVTGLGKLNGHLEDEEVLAYPMNGTWYDLRYSYGIDAFTFLTELAETRDTISVALGHDALYMHCCVLEDEGAYDKTDDTVTFPVDPREPDGV